MSNALKCRMFSATKAADREVLGQRVTEFLASAEVKELVDRTVQLSSDDQFHCVLVTIWYR